MVKPRKDSKPVRSESAATVGYDAPIWQMADTLRDYKFPVASQVSMSLWK